MAKYFIIYNNQTNLDINLFVAKRPSKPSAEMEYDEVKVPGGKTLYREKGYKDIDITVSFNFISKNNEWDNDFRRIKEWLLSKKDKKLKFSDDLEVYYKVNKVTINTPDRILKRIGKFEVTFTCEPYIYIEEEETELRNIVHNKYLVAKPVFRIVGNGILTLTINNKIIKADVGQELIIDTEKGLCYRNGIIDNVALTGKYEDMYLLNGENTFTWSNGFEIYITPNLRCI